MKNIYLDNNATTPILPEAIIAIEDMLTNYGNPSSMHEAGRIVKEKITAASENIASLFNGNADDFIFTSCATESNNTILKSVLFQKYNFTPNIIISNIEHPAILNTAKFLAKNGIDVTFLPVNSNGVIEPEDLKKALKDTTVLISIMTANNEIGTIQPIEEIGKIALEREIFFHTDAVQAAGMMNFDVSSLPISAASFSAHKMYAPKGIGLLYIKNLQKQKKHITPLLHGGHQGNGLRAGTENTIGIVAYGAAAEYMKKNLDTEISYLKNLRDSFENKVKSEIPDIKIHAESAPRKPNTSNISFKYIEGESILLGLDMDGIKVSTGSACSTGSLDPSHVITAIDTDVEAAHGSIRFSFGRTNDESDIKYTVEKLAKVVSNLREISPLSKK
ncbi:MAG: cysteine desulfurase [Spirochaetes bacterium]|nr:cysteine desulfurase [Spirochaetota bacterium]